MLGRESKQLARDIVVKLDHLDLLEQRLVLAYAAGLCDARAVSAAAGKKEEENDQ